MMAFNLKFWKRDRSSATQPVKKKRSGAKELPQQVGQHLVVKKNQDPDYVWSLKCVMQPSPAGEEVMDIRIFNPEQAHRSGTRITEYAALDESPELILYQGWYNRETKEVHLEIH